jgi:hypothetical protein
MRRRVAGNPLPERGENEDAKKHTELLQTTEKEA